MKTNIKIFLTYFTLIVAISPMTLIVAGCKSQKKADVEEEEDEGLSDAEKKKRAAEEAARKAAEEERKRLADQKAAETKRLAEEKAKRQRDCAVLTKQSDCEMPKINNKNNCRWLAYHPWANKGTVAGFCVLNDVIATKCDELSLETCELVGVVAGQNCQVMGTKCVNYKPAQKLALQAIIDTKANFDTEAGIAEFNSYYQDLTDENKKKLLIELKTTSGNQTIFNKIALAKSSRALNVLLKQLIADVGDNEKVKKLWSQRASDSALDSLTNPTLARPSGEDPILLGETINIVLEGRYDLLKELEVINYRNALERINSATDKDVLKAFYENRMPGSEPHRKVWADYVAENNNLTSTRSAYRELYTVSSDKPDFMKLLLTAAFDADRKTGAVTLDRLARILDNFEAFFGSIADPAQVNFAIGNSSGKLPLALVQQLTPGGAKLSRSTSGSFGKFEYAQSAISSYKKLFNAKFQTQSSAKWQTFVDPLLTQIESLVDTRADAQLLLILQTISPEILFNEAKFANRAETSAFQTQYEAFSSEPGNIAKLVTYLTSQNASLLDKMTKGLMHDNLITVINKYLRDIEGASGQAEITRQLKLAVNNNTPLINLTGTRPSGEAPADINKAIRELWSKNKTTLNALPEVNYKRFLSAMDASSTSKDLSDAYDNAKDELAIKNAWVDRIVELFVNNSAFAKSAFLTVYSKNTSPKAELRKRLLTAMVDADKSNKYLTEHLIAVINNLSGWFSDTTVNADTFILGAKGPGALPVILAQYLESDGGRLAGTAVGTFGVNARTAYLIKAINALNGIIGTGTGAAGKWTTYANPLVVGLQATLAGDANQSAQAAKNLLLLSALDLKTLFERADFATDAGVDDFKRQYDFIVNTDPNIAAKLSAFKDAAKNNRNIFHKLADAPQTTKTVQLINQLSSEFTAASSFVTKINEDLLNALDTSTPARTPLMLLTDPARNKPDNGDNLKKAIVKFLELYPAQFAALPANYVAKFLEVVNDLTDVQLAAYFKAMTQDEAHFKVFIDYLAQNAGKTNLVKSAFSRIHAQATASVQKTLRKLFLTALVDAELGKSTILADSVIADLPGWFPAGGFGGTTLAADSADFSFGAQTGKLPVALAKYLETKPGGKLAAAETAAFGLITNSKTSYLIKAVRALNDIIGKAPGNAARWQTYANPMVTDVGTTIVGDATAQTKAAQAILLLSAVDLKALFNGTDFNTGAGLDEFKAQYDNIKLTNPNAAADLSTLKDSAKNNRNILHKLADAAQTDKAVQLINQLMGEFSAGVNKTLLSTSDTSTPAKTPLMLLINPTRNRNEKEDNLKNTIKKFIQLDPAQFANLPVDYVSQLIRTMKDIDFVKSVFSQAHKNANANEKKNLRGLLLTAVVDADRQAGTTFLQSSIIADLAGWFPKGGFVGANDPTLLPDSAEFSFGTHTGTLPVALAQYLVSRGNKLLAGPAPGNIRTVYLTAAAKKLSEVMAGGWVAFAKSQVPALAQSIAPAPNTQAATIILRVPVTDDRDYKSLNSTEFTKFLLTNMPAPVPTDKNKAKVYFDFAWGKSDDILKAWLNYALKTPAGMPAPGVVVLKEVFKDEFTRNAPFTSDVTRKKWRDLLFTTAYELDVAEVDQAKKVYLPGLIRDSAAWFGTNAAQFNIAANDFTFDLAGGMPTAGPLPIALAQKMSNQGVSKLRADNTYFKNVVTALKPNVGSETQWDAFVSGLKVVMGTFVQGADPAAVATLLGQDPGTEILAKLSGKVFTNAAQTNEINKLIKDFIGISNASQINAELAKAPAPNQNHLLQKILSIPDLKIRRDLLEGLLKPLTDPQRLNILDMVSGSGALRLPIWQHLALAAINDTAINEDQKLAPVMNLVLRALAVDTTVDKRVKDVGDLIWDNVIYPTQATRAQSILRLKNLLSWDPSLKIRNDIVVDLASSQIQSLNLQGRGIIHVLLDGNIDADVVTIVNGFYNAISSADRRNWVEQQYTHYGSRTALNLLLMKDFTNPDEERRIKALINLIAPDSLTLVKQDNIWRDVRNIVSNLQFFMPAEKTKGVNILARLDLLPLAIQRLFEPLVYDSTASQAVPIGNANTASLFQKMARGPIDDSIVQIFQTFLGKIMDPTHKAEVINANTDTDGSALDAIQTLSFRDPGDGNTTFSRFTSADVSGDQAGPRSNLFRLLVDNGADVGFLDNVINPGLLRAIYNIIGNYTKTVELFAIQLKEPGNIVFLADWASKANGRAAVISKIVKGTSWSTTQKAILKGSLIAQAIIGDVNEIRDTELGFLDSYSSSDLPRYARVVENLTSYGINALTDQLRLPDQYIGNIIWIIAKAINDEYTSDGSKLPFSSNDTLLLVSGKARANLSLDKLREVFEVISSENIFGAGLPRLIYPNAMTWKAALGTQADDGHGNLQATAFAIVQALANAQAGAEGVTAPTVNVLWRDWLNSTP